MQSFNSLGFVSSSLLLLTVSGCGQNSSTTEESQGEEIEDVDDLPTPSDDIGEDTGLPSESDGGDGSDGPEDTGEVDQPAETITYAYGDDDSLLYVQVWKDEDAWGSGWAHDHVIRASNWAGAIDYNVEDLDECTMSFSLPVDDLIVDEDSMREYVGLEGTLSSSDRDTVKEHMLGSDQLYSDRYSEISFDSSSCAYGNSSANTLVVLGSLTIRGQSDQVSVELDFNLRGDQLYLSGDLDISATQFGFDPYSAYGGAVRNLDDMRITLDMVGTAQ